MLKIQHDVRLSNGVVVEVDNTQFSPILFCGDQLTVARMRGAMTLRDTHDTPVDRCEGIAPVIEDWHARMALMKVLFITHTVKYL